MGRNQRPQRRRVSDTVIGYVRASTGDQTLGPEAQRTALENWCTARSAVLADVFTRCRRRCVARPAAGIARGTGSAEETQRQHAARSEARRLARDVLVAAMVERLAERDGARVLAADGTAEGDGPEAVLMRRIVDAFAEYERLVIKARTREALAVRRTRGERIGGIPYGY